MVVRMTQSEPAVLFFCCSDDDFARGPCTAPKPLIGGPEHPRRPLVRCHAPTPICTHQPRAACPLEEIWFPLRPPERPSALHWGRGRMVFRGSKDGAQSTLRSWKSVARSATRGSRCGSAARRARRLLFLNDSPHRDFTAHRLQVLSLFGRVRGNGDKALSDDNDVWLGRGCARAHENGDGRRERPVGVLSMAWRRRRWALICKHHTEGDLISHQHGPTRWVRSVYAVRGFLHYYSERLRPFPR